MASQVLVNVSVRASSASHSSGINSEQIAIDVSDGDATVGELSNILSERLNVHSSNLSLILCGRKLSNETPIESLLLGPQTVLNAFIGESGENSERKKNLTQIASSSRTVDSSNSSTFKVFCKKCDQLESGKLRVFCAVCSSSCLIVQRDPTCWDDVLKPGLVKGNCKNCEEETFAVFCFKCIACNDIAVPLKEVHSYQGIGFCSICEADSMLAVVVLECHHQTCNDCFSIYVKNALERQQFRIIPAIGYTVTCPVYGCGKHVVDSHTFYVLGAKMYAHYQKQAAEKFVELQDDGITCANPDCGAKFFFGLDSSRNKVICPECHCTFCIICNQIECVCDDPDASQATIERICRRCPTCATPTERTTGCAHMCCAQCGTNWCFICGKLWNEDCQWDHWFN